MALWWRATWARRSASTTARTWHRWPASPPPPGRVWTRAGACVRRVEDAGAAAVEEEVAGVAHLAAGLRVEGAAVEDDPVLRSRGQHVARLLAADAQHRGGRIEHVVADEQRVGQLRAALEADADARRLAACALLRHGGLEPGPVDRDPALSGHLDGQLDGQAKGVMQPERLFSGDGSGTGVQQRRRGGRRPASSVRANASSSVRSVLSTSSRMLDDLRVGVAHSLDDSGDARRQAALQPDRAGRGWPRGG